MSRLLQTLHLGTMQRPYFTRRGRKLHHRFGVRKTQFFVHILLKLCVIGPFPLACHCQSQLTPIAPYGKYETVVSETLIGDHDAIGWMTARPSFGSEYAVIIEPRTLPNRPDELAGYVVELAVASRPIWHYDTTSQGRLAITPRKHVAVKRSLAQLSEKEGRNILDAWFRALRGVKYSESPDIGLDGTTFDFHSGNRYGSAWSPAGDDALLMVQSGECLARFASSGESSRASIMAECLKFSDAISDD